MDQLYYRAGQFARKASVSVRTLRYYDQEGLLAPSAYSEAGYRLYSDSDLVNLQQILALKFLGFSLEEIKVLLNTGPAPQSLPEVLAQQRRMMQAKRDQLDGIIQAISRTERMMRAGQSDWNSLVNVIQAIQVEQNREWVNKYFTPEQQEQMKHLSEQTYSDEARQKLTSRSEWTEADQERASAQWNEVNTGIARLAAENADPAGAEAQQIAAQYNNLIGQFTGGDVEIAEGLKKWWQNHNALPDNEKPVRPTHSKEQQEWLEKALAVYRERK